MADFWVLWLRSDPGHWLALGNGICPWERLLEMSGKWRLGRILLFFKSLVHFKFLGGIPRPLAPPHPPSPAHTIPPAPGMRRNPAWTSHLSSQPLLRSPPKPLPASLPSGPGASGSLSFPLPHSPLPHPMAFYFTWLPRQCAEVGVGSNSSLKLCLNS